MTPNHPTAVRAMTSANEGSDSTNMATVLSGDPQQLFSPTPENIHAPATFFTTEDLLKQLHFLIFDQKKKKVLKWEKRTFPA